jgi:hypothetical protein
MGVPKTLDAGFAGRHLIPIDRRVPNAHIFNLAQRASV